MIKLQPKPTFVFEVAVATPGESEPSRFKLTAKHMGQAALNAWADRAKEMSGKDAAYLCEVVTGWDGVLGEDGKAVPFSEAKLEEFLDAYPGAGVVIFTAYLREIGANRQKN